MFVLHFDLRLDVESIFDVDLVLDLHFDVDFDLFWMCGGRRTDKIVKTLRATRNSAPLTQA